MWVPRRGGAWFAPSRVWWQQLGGGHLCPALLSWLHGAEGTPGRGTCGGSRVWGVRCRARRQGALQAAGDRSERRCTRAWDKLKQLPRAGPPRDVL